MSFPPAAVITFLYPRCNFFARFSFPFFPLAPSRKKALPFYPLLPIKRLAFSLRCSAFSRLPMRRIIPPRLRPWRTGKAVEMETSTGGNGEKTGRRKKWESGKDRKKQTKTRSEPSATEEGANKKRSKQNKTKRARVRKK